jgi:hypothetical protein
VLAQRCAARDGGGTGAPQPGHQPPGRRRYTQEAAETAAVHAGCASQIAHPQALHLFAAGQQII